MAAISSKKESDLKEPEGDFEGWDKSTTKDGQTYYSRAVKDGKAVAKPADGDEPEHGVDSHGANFYNEPVDWDVCGRTNTSEDFKNKTGECNA